ncbi:hypothetical protein PAGU2595_020550 [Lysobacter xanthus]
MHAESLDHLSPRVQAQLAQRRRMALQGTAASRPSRGLLPWAGVATAGLALALVLQLRPPAGAPPQGVPAAASPQLAANTPADGTVRDVDAIAPDLSEDPEFYLWLGAASPAATE